MFDFLRQRAYLQLALAMSAGCALGACFPPPLLLLFRDWWLFLVLGLALAALWAELHLRKNNLSILAGFALLVLIGYLHAGLAMEAPGAQPLLEKVRQLAAPGSSTPQLRLRGRVASIPKLQRGHLRFMLDVRQARPWVDLRAHREVSLSKAGHRAQSPFPEWTDAAGRAFIFMKCEEAPSLELGDRVELTATLEEVLPPQNFGQFDYRGYLLQKGCVITGYAPSVFWLRVDEVGRNKLWLWLSALRGRLVGELEARLPNDLADLAVGTVFGDKASELDSDLEERFRRAGLSHILVASGTQVSLLIGCLMALAWRRLRGPRAILQVLLTMSAVVIYSALAGMETSIVRALVMGAIVLITRLLRRDSDGMSSLAQAALILLTVSPLQIVSAGFQLSFAATFGLIYLNGITLPWISRQGADLLGIAPGPQPGLTGLWLALRSRVSSWLPGWREALLAAMSTTIGAQLFVIPILACQFNQLSIWGLFSNAVAVPISFLLLVGGACLSFGIGALPLIGQLLERIVAGLCSGLDALAALFARLPGSDLAVPAFPWWLVLSFYGLVFCLGEMFKHGREDQQNGAVWRADPRRPLAWSSLVFILVCSWSILYHVIVPRPEVSVLSLPGSSAYLWRTPTGETWILASPTGLSRNRNTDKLLSSLRSRGINSLSGIVWLGAEPVSDPLRMLSGPRYSLSTPPSGTDEKAPVWLCNNSGRIWGAVLPLGSSVCLAVLDTRTLTHSDELMQQANLVVGSISRGNDTDAEKRLAELSAGAKNLIVVKPSSFPRSLHVQPNGLAVNGNELRIRADWRGRWRLKSSDPS